MRVSIKLNIQNIRKIEQAAKEAAVEAMEIVKRDLENSATMPFASGNLQNGGTYIYERKDGSSRTGATVSGNEIVDFSEGDVIHIGLTNDAPQARRLYYHPEYNFRKGGNENAGGEWLEPYISGDKKDLIAAEFTKSFKEKTGI